MPLRVNNNILNQRGTPAFFSDVFANRPAFGFAGRVFISTDTGAIYEDTGSAWTLIADAGAGTTGTLQQVTTNGNTTSQGLVVTAGNVAIGTATAGAPLDIHCTGTAAQFNGTGTNNAYVFFQNAGASKWRLGNTYNAGANSFGIYNNGLATNALTINSSSNTANFLGNLQVGATSYNLARLNVQDVLGTYLVDLINGSEGNWKLRTYNNGSAINTLVFKQGLFYDSTENSAIKFYRGGTFTDGYIALSTTATDRLTITAIGNTLLNTTNDNGNLLQINGNVSTGTKMIYSNSSYVLTDGLNSVTISASSTGDIFLFRNNANSVIGNVFVCGILTVSAVDSTTSGNQAEYIYSVMSAGNGAPGATFTNIGANSRGTNPVSSIFVADDGTSGAIKIRATTTGITTRFTITFIGQIY
jgi:hypothetical protein